MAADTGSRTVRRLHIPATDRTDRVTVAVRAGILLLVVLLTFSVDQADGLRGSLLLLITVAALASIPVPPGWTRRARPIVEGAAAATIIVISPDLAVTLLPYLLVPPFAAGVIAGVRMAIATSAVTAVVLVGGRVMAAGAIPPDDQTALAEWIGLGLAVGLIGAWTRSVTVRTDSRHESYLAANRLLAQLRDVARALPEGLDEISIAQGALWHLREEIGFDHGGLFTVTENGVLVPLAVVGDDRLDWLPDLSSGVWGRAWRQGSPVSASGRFDGDGVVSDHGWHVAVLPLMMGERRTGLVGIEREGSAWSAGELIDGRRVLDDAVLALDSGHLFSEVRALATVEERRRLAREIHDGVAQEIAALGFAVDDLRYRAKDPAIRTDLDALRNELSRVVNELRLSIYDLRSDVQPAAGLGASLTSYVRQVGTGSGMTVHLVLDESPQRLAIEIETELLRIAQEAITNARRHSQARNLWVTCRVAPPGALLRVADDGQGLGTPRADSFGMEIMRERAARIGATMSLRGRVGGCPYGAVKPLRRWAAGRGACLGAWRTGRRSGVGLGR